MDKPPVDLNCEGLSCPVPLIQLSKALRALPAGARIQVSASDPAFGPDVEAWTRMRGEKLVSFTQEGARQFAVIEKA